MSQLDHLQDIIASLADWKVSRLSSRRVLFTAPYEEKDLFGNDLYSKVYRVLKAELDYWAHHNEIFGGDEFWIRMGRVRLYKSARRPEIVVSYLRYG